MKTENGARDVTPAVASGDEAVEEATPENSEDSENRRSPASVVLGVAGTAASQRAASGAERRLGGVAVSPGLAIGPALVGDNGELPVVETSIAPNGVEKERARFAEAVAVSQKQLRKLKTKAATLPGSAADEIGYMLDAHLAMLTNSRLVRGVDKRIAGTRINAERAVQLQIDEIGSSFAAMSDSYLAARVEDIRVVGNRLIRNLIKKPYVAFSAGPEGSVILAEELSPADTALIDPRRIAGFATVVGGTESHTAIMARALGLPAVLAVPGLLEGVRAGDTVVIDGSAGIVIVNPTAETLQDVVARQDAFALHRRQLGRLRKLPAQTRDGEEITLDANLELPIEIPQALSNGAQGLGLVRTEFLFMNRPDLPGEEEQFAAYSVLVRGMEGRPVTLRTLDIGGDKMAEALPASGEHEAANPALSLRAIRLSLRERRLLEIQLAAMLRASAEGPLRILLPLITTADEIRTVREVLEQVARRLRRRGIRLPKHPPPLGAMIEVPGAALAADWLATEADFFAIGTNDLIQYTLAIDRSDEQVAHLYNPLHPAILRLIQFSVEAAMRRRLPISLCGEMAGDPRYVPLLLGLGLRSLSMAPRSIPLVKQRIRSLDLAATSRKVRAIMDQTDAARISSMVDELETSTDPH